MHDFAVAWDWGAVCGREFRFGGASLALVGERWEDRKDGPPVDEPSDLGFWVLHI